jgi:hypothetical protein
MEGLYITVQKEYEQVAEEYQEALNGGQNSEIDRRVAGFKHAQVDHDEEK